MFVTPGQARNAELMRAIYAEWPNYDVVVLGEPTNR